MPHPEEMCTCGHAFDVMKSERLSRVIQEQTASDDDLVYRSVACNNQNMFAFGVVSQHRLGMMLILCEPVLLNIL